MIQSIFQLQCFLQHKDVENKLHKAEGKQHEVSPDTMEDCSRISTKNKLYETDIDIEKPVEGNYNIRFDILCNYETPRRL